MFLEYTGKILVRELVSLIRIENLERRTGPNRFVKRGNAESCIQDLGQPPRQCFV